jgi:hypothetical protein
MMTVFLCSALALQLPIILKAYADALSCAVVYTPRVASSATSAESATAGLIRPFSKLRVSATRMMPSSTWARCVPPLYPDLCCPICLCSVKSIYPHPYCPITLNSSDMSDVLACCVCLQGEDGATGLEGPRHLGACLAPAWELGCCQVKIQVKPPPACIWCQCPHCTCYILVSWLLLSLSPSSTMSCYVADNCIIFRCSTPQTFDYCTLSLHTVITHGHVLRI